MIFFCAAIAFGAEPFITAREYGQALYERYESLSCADCHGQNAEGKTLAYYEKKRKLEAIHAPALQNLSREALKNGLARHGFGPPYYMSDSEIDALAAYLSEP
jgi:mono/diheme cytochrome c family protein